MLFLHLKIVTDLYLEKVSYQDKNNALEISNQTFDVRSLINSNQ